ncbi:MAG: PilZ domain-containing protein [Candidatus Aureabacteria bacterium]|nr:PilZ domain-containing protein [Candidatus Auribacterota bacterium]
MAFGGINRRQSKRFNFQTDITLKKETSALTPIKGITRDLSLGGASCLIVSQIKVFTIVKLKVVIDEQEQVEISGRVTWIREIEDEANELDQPVSDSGDPNKAYLIGIQFLTLYSTKKEKLKKVLEKYGNR